MALNDRIFLSNDSVGGGIKTDAQEFFFSPVINETSAVATSSEQLIPFVKVIEPFAPRVVSFAVLLVVLNPAVGN